MIGTEEMQMDSGWYQEIRRRVLSKTAACNMNPSSRSTEDFTPQRSLLAFLPTIHTDNHCSEIEERIPTVNAAVAFAASHQQGLALVLNSPESATQFRGYTHV